MDFPAKPWPIGRAEQLEPLVRRVLATNPGPYTFTGTETYLVGAAGALAVIDPGPNDPDHLAALLEIIGDTPVTAILCTHTHRDHSPLAAPLAAATGAPIVGCAPSVLPADWPSDRVPFDIAYAPDRVLADGESVSGPDWTLTAVATPGRIANHLCYALEESGALFTGDHVMGWSTSVIAGPDGDMGDYMASLEKIHQRDDRVYYPAHGPQVDNPKQLVRGMIGHRRQRERQILRLLEQGPATIAAIVPQMYKGLPEPLLHGAAASIHAHLVDLERRGMVSRREDEWKLVGG